MGPLPSRHTGVNCVAFVSNHRDRVTVIKPQSASQCPWSDMVTGPKNVLDPCERFAQLLSDNPRRPQPRQS